MIHGEFSILQSSECWHISALREGDAARVHDALTLFVMREFPKMGMTVDDAVVWTFWHVLLIIYVAMGQEIALAVVYQQGVSLHNREIKQHLVYLRIAVATHGNNLVSQGLQPLHDALGVDALGNAVAGTIVNDVAHNAHHVALLLLEEIEHFLQRRQAAVDI